MSTTQNLKLARFVKGLLDGLLELLIVASLFILLLSYIWSYGLDLERERALTI